MSEPVSRRGRLAADLLLLLVAVIWGSAFVAQRMGMEHVHPFIFNAGRFAMGGLVLFPVVLARRRRKEASAPYPSVGRPGLLLGLLLVVGASLQQIGLVYTSAGKAGFITGLYVVLVPLLLAVVWRKRVRWTGWLAASLAAIGLFLLSVKGDFRLAPGDGWVLAGALAWSLHVIAVGRLAPGRDPLRLALAQYTVCAFLSLILSLTFEWGAWGGILKAWPEVLYTGVLSVGIGYTGQVVAQRRTAPADAAILLSLEAVFAALFGWLLLGEALSGRQLAGCGLMLAAMLLAQSTL